MVDSKSIELKGNDDCKSDFESKKNKLDSKDEATLSFYECPTAAASIQGFGEEDRYNSNSFDSDQEFNYSDSLGKSDPLQFTNNIDNFNFGGTGPNSSEGGSVSTSQFTKANGGYFAGYQAVLYEGNPTLNKKPENFLDENSLKLPESNVNYIHNNNPDLNYIQMSKDLNSPESATPYVSGFKIDENLVPFTPNYTYTTTAMYQPSYTQVNSMTENVIPFTVTSVRSECSNVNEFSKGGSSAPSMSPNTFTNTTLLPSIAEGPSPDSNSSFPGNSSTLSYIPEGFETISVPKYRPVEVVERTVEVPVVHHIDTFVPKKEIQEVESYVKKPYTKYVDKVVEVPQVHYTDKIVEVPEYHEVTKTVPKVEVQEKTNYVPKVEVKVVPKYVEVPVVKIVDKYEEYEQVEEVVKHVEKVEVVEVPKEVVKTVVKPVRKIVEKEKIVPVYEHRDVPVEKIKYVPKIETVEHLREVPKVVDVPVPYNVPKHQYVDQPYVVPKYRDVPVAVPVAKTVKPIYEDKGPTNYIDVPVHKPYFVIHDHLNFKPVSSFSANNNVSQFQTANVNNGFVSNNFNVNPAGNNPNFNGFNHTNFANNQVGRNPGFNNNFVPNTNFNLGGEFKDYQEVSYRVVGMNKVDFDRMPPDEKKKAQDKLNEALDNPNFEVYKKSVEGTVDNNFGNTNNTFNNFNVTSNPEPDMPFANVNVNAPGFSTWNSPPTSNFNNGPASNDWNGGNFNPFGFNVNKNPNQNVKLNVSNNGAGNFTNNVNPNNNFGQNWNNWARWNSDSLNNVYPNSNSFQTNLNNNFNNKYKYDSNYSTSLFNWTDKLFKFFTGSKSPAATNSNKSFNLNLNNGKFKAHPGSNNTKNYPNDKNPFNDLNSSSSKSNFWNQHNYNLLQESFRNWKVPNVNLDLEKNTPSNKMFFQETENPYAKSSQDQYHMSSGSGSVGHRANKSFDKSNVYPTSELNSPTVH